MLNLKLLSISGMGPLILALIKTFCFKLDIRFRNWIEMGSRNEDISGETRYCEPQVLKVNLK